MRPATYAMVRTFLSIQAQDFIEESLRVTINKGVYEFLSIQAQDFIEDRSMWPRWRLTRQFLSIQAQDFIEEIHIRFLRDDTRHS